MLFWVPKDGNGHCILEERFIVDYSPIPQVAVRFTPAQMINEVIQMTIFTSCIFKWFGHKMALPVMICIAMQQFMIALIQG